MLIQWHTTYFNKNIYTLNWERACSKPQRMAPERVKTRGFRWGPSASRANHIRQHEPNPDKRRAEAPRPHRSRGPQRAQTPLMRRRCLRRKIEGNLANSSDQQLRETCKRRGIPSRDKREELIGTIDFYNRQKRSNQSENEDEGPLNIGLPKADDRLSPPTADKVLGTPKSEVYHGPYHLYLRDYENKNNTTEGAWTLQYWLLLRSLAPTYTSSHVLLGG